MLTNGRIGFWDNSLNGIVIFNPYDPDLGTVFRPDSGYNYFLKQ